MAKSVSTISQLFFSTDNAIDRADRWRLLRGAHAESIAWTAAELHLEDCGTVLVQTHRYLQAPGHVARPYIPALIMQMHTAISAHAHRYERHRPSLPM